MPNGTCPHHEHIDKSIKRIDATCAHERGRLQDEVNAMKKWAITGLAAVILNLLGILTTLMVVLAKG